MNVVKKNPSPGRFASFRITAQLYPSFSEAALRSYRLSNRNGFNRCVRQLGRRVVIDLVEFESWVDAHRSNGGPRVQQSIRPRYRTS